MAAIERPLRSQPRHDKLVMFGSAELVGEIRPRQRGHECLKEAARFSFAQAIGPGKPPKHKIAGMTTQAVPRLNEMIRLFREG